MDRVHEPYRSQLMVRIRAEATLGFRLLEREIEQRLARHRARLAKYREIEKNEFAQPKLSRSQSITYLILKKGMMNESTWIDWSLEALRVLRKP